MWAQSDSLQPEIVSIPAGQFISGSNRQERDEAYRLDEAAYGHSVTRTQRWYESEHDSQVRHLPQFSIMKNPVTRCEYAQFVQEANYKTPQISEPQWQAQRLKHSYLSTKKFQWKEPSQESDARCHHPVVLVTHDDAMAYAVWLSEKTGQEWRLPNEFEWEKAARGSDGRRFPWGNAFDATKLNSHDAGPFDTIAVGAFREGASPYGVLDAAGQVFEWTATANSEANRFIVKGGSWDDKGCGVCRSAARHYRHQDVKHILIGFRLITD